MACTQVHVRVTCTAPLPSKVQRSGPREVPGSLTATGDRFCWSLRRAQEDSSKVTIVSCPRAKHLFFTLPRPINSLSNQHHSVQYWFVQPFSTLLTVQVPVSPPSFTHSCPTSQTWVAYQLHLRVKGGLAETLPRRAKSESVSDKPLFLYIHTFCSYPHLTSRTTPPSSPTRCAY